MKTSQYGLDRSYVVIEGIPHIPQEDSWDCGLACLKMVLRYIKPTLTDGDISKACSDHQLGETVWTIDLTFLCARLGVKHQFYTQTLGVNNDYSRESFYSDEMKSDFTKEEQRVNDLFAKSTSLDDVRVEKKSVGITDILHHLKKDQPIIVLVDDRKLIRHPETVRKEDEGFDLDMSCFGCCFVTNYRRGYTDVETQSNIQSSEGYWGHYVVIVGYDLNQKMFILNDPARGGEHLRCDFETMETARKSFGTDEDILFLFPD